MRRILLLTAFAGTLLAACDSEPDATASTALPVSVMQVPEAVAYDVPRQFTGLVEARRGVRMAFEIAGSIDQVLVEEGDAVSAGQVLIRLDPRRYAAASEEARAAVVSAEAELRLAEATLKRQRGLRESGAVSEQSLDEAQRGEASARAGVAEARARRDRIQVDLERTEIQAPFAGRVTARLVDEGQFVAAGVPVLELRENEGLELRLPLPPRVASQMAVGDTLAMRHADGIISGRIRAIVPQQNQAARAVDVLVSTPQTLGQWRAGDAIGVTLSLPQEQTGIALPLDALQQAEKGLWSVYRVVDGRAMITEVERLQLLGDEVMVRGPLVAGDRVIRGGLHRLAPGVAVRVIEEPSAVDDSE